MCKFTSTHVRELATCHSTKPTLPICFFELLLNGCLHTCADGLHWYLSWPKYRASRPLQKEHLFQIRSKRISHKFWGAKTRSLGKTKKRRKGKTSQIFKNNYLLQFAARVVLSGSFHTCQRPDVVAVVAEKEKKDSMSAKNEQQLEQFSNIFSLQLSKNHSEFLFPDVCITTRDVEHAFKTSPSPLAAKQLPKVRVT